MVEIKYKYQSGRREKATKLWKQWAREFNKGKSVKKISEESFNPETNKPYTMSNIYWALKQVEKMPA